MDESNDRCNWKKVFKKFLDPPKPVESDIIRRSSIENSIPITCDVDQEKSIFETSIISCSPASNDSNYSKKKTRKHLFRRKLQIYDKMHDETDYTLEKNLNQDARAESYRKLFLNSSNHELNMNVPKTNHCNSEFNMNISQTNGCKSKFEHKLPSKMLSQERNVDVPQAWAVPESHKFDNIHHGEVPEWNKAFKSILGDSSPVTDVPHQKDIIHPSKLYKESGNVKTSGESNQRKQPSYEPKGRYEKIKKYKDYEETGNIRNSDTSVITSQRKQRSYEPERRYEKAKKYEDYKVSEAEEKAKEIFARSRMFKVQQFNLNDFHGCGVDLFKQDKSGEPLSGSKPTPLASRLAVGIQKQDKSSSKPTFGSSELIDKPYLPLTGFIAKLKPYTTADVVASYVPFDEDPWDDDLLI